jgi:phosphoglycolate phosphatase-like HAD superfamily hydrolase
MSRAAVGFDLDMTLIDSRQAILGSFAAVAAETGVPIETAAVERRLGIKLEDELGYWFPAREIAAAMAIYRSNYRQFGGALTRPLPGAAEALAAVRAAGAPAIVVTAKLESTARMALAGVGLVADEVFGDVHGPQKAVVLARLGAAVYVGDTPPDMAAAVASGAVPIGVATGSFTADELRAAGADHVLASLAEFPALYARISG